MTPDWEQLFQAATVTPGGHHGPVVSVYRRPDGVVLRARQGDDVMEMFLDLGNSETLADVLMDVVYTAQWEQCRQTGD